MSDHPFSDARPCQLGVGCDEAGVCYTEAHGEPDQCPNISKACQLLAAEIDLREVPSGR